jgi:D-xylose transport system permease protein
MSSAVEPPPPAQAAAVAAATAPAEETDSLLDLARRRIQALRQGELGSLPIIVGIVVIAIYFQSQNSKFLTAGNMVNLMVQMAPVAIIGMGIVFVLLLGEIDLSVGYVSGVGGVIAALLLLPDGNQLPAGVGLIVALAAGLAIGLGQGILFAKVGIPSFVVTLAGLLGWNGVVLLLIGDRGTVVIQSGFINGIANDFLPKGTGWLAIEGAVVLYALILLLGRRSRRKASLPLEPIALLALKIAVPAVLATIVVAVANNDRGVPYVGLVMLGALVFWTIVAERTRFGRHVYAVGGNAEAARRAGINVDRIRIAVFGISGLMAALGGIVLASRLSSVDTNTGGGSILLFSIAAAVIGGTSLFGGRGKVNSALLGAVVIASIDNGLGLMQVKDSTKFIVTAVVLLAAVTVDSISRRGLESSGRA